MLNWAPPPRRREAGGTFFDPWPSGGDFGYTVYTVIDFLADWLPRQRPGMRLLVKGHPHQSPPLRRSDSSSWEDRGIAFELTEEPVKVILARADEVYGMTSVVLLIALATGEPIVSFQPGRNQAGVLESNTHLERHVVV